MERFETPKPNELLNARFKPRIHKGVTLHIADFHGMVDEKEILRLAQDITDKIRDMGRKDLRLLVDVRGSLDSAAGQLKFAEAARQIKPYCARMAAIGITPVKAAIMGVINKITGMGVQGFSAELDALDWLIG